MPSTLGIIAGAGSLKNPAEPSLLDYRENLIPNPSFEINSTGWSAVAGATLSRVATESFIGSIALQVVNASSSAAQHAILPLGASTSQYTVSAYVKVAPGSTTANYFIRVLQYETVGGATVSSGNVGLRSVSSADGWVRLSGTFTKAASANFVIIRVATASTTSGDTFFVDNVLLERGTTLSPYFDGSIGGFWTGTPHLSTSGASKYLDGHWILSMSNVDGTGGAYYGNAVKVDAAGNVYSSFSPGSDNKNVIVKSDRYGNVLWQRAFQANDNAGTSIYDIDVDEDYNVYIAGSSGSLTTALDGVVVKLDKDGTLLWQRKQYGEYEEAYAVAVDGSGNVFVTGSTYYSPPNNTSDLYVCKYDPSGTLLWKTQIQGGSFDEEWTNSCGVDSSGNFYGTCYRYTNDSNIFTFKLDPNGVLQWQRNLDLTITDEEGKGLAVSPAGNIYIAAWGPKSYVIRYDSSGNLQWQRELDDNGYGNYLAIDSSENVYMAGGVYIYKYNSSGVLQWQRALGDILDSAIHGLDVNAGNMAIVTTKYDVGAPPVSYTSVVILPTDGTKSGSYATGGYTLSYGTSSVAEQAGTLTGSTPSLTASTSLVIDAAGSWTMSTGNLVYNKYDAL